MMNEQSRFVQKWSGKLIYLDGVFGRETQRALQCFLSANGYPLEKWAADGRLIEGVFGTESIIALQTYLTERGYTLRKYGIDGKWGKETTTALQKYLNSFKLSFPIPVDGNLGQWTVALLQLFLNRVVCA